MRDAQVLDALEFNIQWQYALGVTPADAHVGEKTLHNYLHQLSAAALHAVHALAVSADGGVWIVIFSKGHEWTSFLGAYDRVGGAYVAAFQETPRITKSVP